MFVNPEERIIVRGNGPSIRKSPTPWDSDHELSPKGRNQRRNPRDPDHGAEMMTWKFSWNRCLMS